MRKLLFRTTIIVLSLAIATVIAVTRPWEYFSRLPLVGAGAALTVNTPLGRSIVYLDDKKVGETPFESEDLTPGDYTIKVERISDTADFYDPVIRHVHLEPNTRAFIEAEIGPNEQFSLIKTIYYRKHSGDSPSLYITSTPADATVWIDDVRYGETPVTSDNITEGDHTLKITYAGYVEAETTIIARDGFTLIADINLLAMPIELD